MDTANKIAQLAHERGLDLVAVGVPKTIDNDVGDSEFRLIDHTPGYGSVARYWMHNVQTANEENAGSLAGRSGAGDAGDGAEDRVHSGRRPAGRPAAGNAAPDLSGREPVQLGATGRPGQRPTPPLRPLHGRHQRGVRRGRPRTTSKDAFGHTAFGSGTSTAAQIVVNYLNRVGLPCKGAARADIPGTDQRRSIAFASPVDLDEAYNVGRKAVELAAAGQSGQMATILRNPGPAYSVRYDKVPLVGGGQQRAGVPPALDRPERLRRDRRFRPLCETLDRRRNDPPADGRRPAADDPLQADLRRTEAAQVRSASGPQVTQQNRESRLVAA